MINLNKAEIIGNVGTKAEMRFTPNGRPVTSFSLACNRRYTKEGDIVEETEWFNVVAWGRLAENCNQYVEKGMLVYVSGRVYLHQWEGQDSQKRSRLEINANMVIFLSKPSINSSSEVEPEDIPY